jgi:hypothetical protein
MGMIALGLAATRRGGGGRSTLEPHFFQTCKQKLLRCHKSSALAGMLS